MIAELRASRWGRAFSAERDTILVWAAEPLRSRLEEQARDRGYAVRAPGTPLEAIYLLRDLAGRIHHAVLGRDLGLPTFLEDEYPEIALLYVDAPS